MWKSKFYGAFTPSTRRLLDGVVVLVPHRAPDSLVDSPQVAGPDHFVDQVVSHLTLTKGYPADCVVYF